MINLTVDNKTQNFSLNQTEYEKVIAEALEKLGYDSNIIIELIFVSPKEIKQLNKTHRQKDAPTDVLSFPQERFGLEKEILGSIVISPQIAREKSEEIDQLIKHGLLHLLGFDHEQNETSWNRAAEKIDCFL